jgi:outer membrane protein OmpA-like peptidoglycan-associated protein
MVPLLLIFALPVLAQEIDLRLEATPATVDGYRKLIERSAPSEDAFIALQRIAAIYLRKQRWSDAAQVYRRFQRFFPADRRIEKIISLLEADSDSITVTNLGRGVNSALGESRPVLTPDGRTLYFSAQKRTSGQGRSDIYRAELSSAGPRGAENLGPKFNTPLNESPLSISRDGRRFYVFGNYEGSRGQGDIFRFDRKGEDWGAMRHLDSAVNSSHFDSDAIENGDGSVLLFVSDRPGGIGEYHEKDVPFHGDIWGNTDIWVAFRKGNGWSAPVNLGATINTPFAERSPWLAPDGRTLYFCSDGHYGLGLLDIFVSRRLRESSWTEWSEPVNLGRSINSADDDMDYRLTGEQTQAIFGSYNRPEGFGGGDIYRADRTPTLLPEPRQASNPPVAPTPVRLNGLLFEYDQAEIMPTADAELRSLAEKVMSRPGVRVEILGHTDSIGSDRYNRRLSLRRARAVVEQLVAIGVPRRRLVAHGYGRQRPIASNASDEGRALNRRVEFRLIEPRAY